MYIYACILFYLIPALECWHPIAFTAIKSNLYRANFEELLEMSSFSGVSLQIN